MCTWCVKVCGCVCTYTVCVLVACIYVYVSVCVRVLYMCSGFVVAIVCLLTDEVPGAHLVFFILLPFSSSHGNL